MDDLQILCQEAGISITFEADGSISASPCEGVARVDVAEGVTVSKAALRKATREMREMLEGGDV